LAFVSFAFPTPDLLPVSPFTRRIGPAVALFFLAPLVGEFLLGNLPITWLPALLLLAPLYGGGPLLFREIARRYDLTWPGIVILGLSFGVIEEAFVTQSLFNPNYLGLRLLDYGFLPALGMSAWWTLFVLSLHTIWSTAVPIALMETLTPAQRHTPWLGPVGVGVTAVIFILGCAVLAAMEIQKGFVASVPQLVASALTVVALVVVVFAFCRRAATASGNATAPSAPSPMVVGATALATGSAFFALLMVHESMSAVLNVAGMLLVLAFGAGRNLTWSRRAGWNERHRVALTGGFLMTYGWWGFVQVPSIGNVSPTVDLIGNVVFASGAVALLVRAVVIARRE